MNHEEREGRQEAGKRYGMKFRRMGNGPATEVSKLWDIDGCDFHTSFPRIAAASGGDWRGGRSFGTRLPKYFVCRSKTGRLLARAALANRGNCRAAWPARVPQVWH